MFEGFSDETIDFLWDLRFNNERPWFNAHKEQFQRVLWEPFRALAGEVYDEFTARHPKEILNLRVSRIYRDARRLFGRGPYKDHLWFSLAIDPHEWEGYPVFWFEINPERYMFGLGTYSPHPELMERFRRELDGRPRAFVTLANRLEKQDRFVLEGEAYARPKGTARPPLDKWYNRKNLDLVCAREPDAILKSPALKAELLDGFEFLYPYYKWFSRLAAGVNQGSAQF